MSDIVVEHQPSEPVEEVTLTQDETQGRKSSAYRHRSMPLATLYQKAIIARCERHAEILRAREYEQLDLVNLVEELEDMGRSEFRATLSYVRQILIHILKLQTFPNDQAHNHWKGEVVTFQSDLDDVVSGSIRYRFEQRGEFDVQQRKALKYLETQYPGTVFQPLQLMTLDEIITWSVDKANQN